MTRTDFCLHNGEIVLRELMEDDIPRYISWNNGDREWKKWDAPWEEVEDDPQKIRNLILRILDRPKPEIWVRLQMNHLSGAHIGSVSTYLIDEDQRKRAIGIDIYEPNCWGKGLGALAVNLWVAYLFCVTDLDCLYTETWSGNVRMVKLAEKCGFVEVQRKTNYREIDGQFYDGLTFRLEREQFDAVNPGLVKNVAEQISNLG